MKEDQVGKCTDAGPVPEGFSVPAAPLVEHSPDGLLGGEIGVSAPGPETGDYEAAV